MDWRYPMKPVRVDEGVFDRLDLSSYTMEKKYDGFRLIMEVNKGIRLYTRQKVSMTVPLNLVSPLESLGLPPGTILDGEIWNEDKRGAWAHDSRSLCRVTFWDVIRFNNKDVSDLPIEDRREILKTSINSNGFVSSVDIDEAKKDDFYRIKADAIGHKITTNSRTGYIHGVVLKKNKSPRRDHSNRSIEHADWLKVVFFQ